ncbi:MAG TPA: SMR family transporter [Labilithrix sp.]|jgi:multidrug transporter EmrE-like cation transporter|nr:SMR family transporter [Labilithrix sp.]
MQASSVLVWTLNIAASLAYAFGAVFMKSSGAFQRPWPSLLVYVCFGLGATLQTYVMKFQRIGSGYTIVLGLEAVAAIGLGVALFREPITMVRWLGIALVLGGVILLRE